MTKITPVRFFDIMVVEPKINTAKVKKRSKVPFISQHRDEKTHAHTTIGGKGHVARLMQKENKNDKSY